MFPRFSRMACVAHKQVLHITLVLKFGKEKNMEENVIYGQLDVYYINSVHFILHLGLKIFQDYIARS